MKKISIIAACSMAVAVQAQLIDDFSVAGLGEYTLTRVNDGGTGNAEANVSFSDASGALAAAYGGTISGPEQVVFLRSDFSLAVGSVLRLDVLFPVQGSQMDFGLAVSATATPTGVGTPTPADTRNTFNWASIYVRPSQNAVRATSSINTVVDTGTGVLTTDETLVSQLFIERNSATLFTLGYINTSSVRVDSRTVTFTTADIGTAIGFYGDLRATGGTLGNLDNLRIELIPEPSIAALLGLGGLAGILRLRRRN